MTKKNAKQIKLPRSVRRLFPQVEYAVDADKPVEVSVSTKDCREAKKLNPTECALAQAARRELKADGVIIGLSSSYVVRGKQAVRFATPPTARLGQPGHDYRKSHGKVKNARRKIHHSARVRILPKGAE